MALRLSINLGFVTNSSSMVHHFPREVLNDPNVAAFIQAFQVEGGFVGDDLWHRGQCSTMAMTPEQKQEVREKLASVDFSHPAIRDDDSVVVIYGDEYQSLASSLAGLMRQAAEKLGYQVGYGEEYN